MFRWRVDENQIIDLNVGVRRHPRRNHANQKRQRLPASYLQPGDLLPESLLLLGQDALVQLGVGLHDALLGRQNFLKVEILTRGDATTKQRDGRAGGQTHNTHRGSRTQARHRPNAHTYTMNRSNEPRRRRRSDHDAEDACKSTVVTMRGARTHTCKIIDNGALATTTRTTTPSQQQGRRRQERKEKRP